MDKEIITNLNQQVFRQFPYFHGIEPEIQQQDEETWLLIYKGTTLTADGHEMPVVVRVITDRTGTVIKLTSSR